MATATTRNRFTKVGLALVLLNELRGVCVVVGVLLSTHGRIF